MKLVRVKYQQYIIIVIIIIIIIIITDIAIGFVRSAYTFSEDSGNIVIPIKKDNSRVSEQDLAVTVKLVSGSSATNSSDFIFSDIDFTFSPSEQQEDALLTILSDSIPEGLESFQLSIHYQSPLSHPENFTTEVFISDNDGKFRHWIGN